MLPGRCPGGVLFRPYRSAPPSGKTATGHPVGACRAHQTPLSVLVTASAIEPDNRTRQSFIYKGHRKF